MKEIRRKKDEIMRIIGKMFGFILAGILSVVIMIIDLAAKIASFAAVGVLFLFVVCIIVAIIQGSWQSIAIMIGLLTVGAVLFFGTAMITGRLELFRDRLLGR